MSRRCSECGSVLLVGVRCRHDALDSTGDLARTEDETSFATRRDALMVADDYDHEEREERAVERREALGWAEKP